MKILGIGVDIINNKRIKVLKKKKIFIKRTFSENEIKHSKTIKNKNNYFAKRFASKEALVKAFGTGFRNNLNLKNIEILNDINGKPYFSDTKIIRATIFKIFKVRKYNLFLSISDEKDYSIAFTILQKL